MVVLILRPQYKTYLTPVKPIKSVGLLLFIKTKIEKGCLDNI